MFRPINAQIYQIILKAAKQAKKSDKTTRVFMSNTDNVREK